MGKLIRVAISWLDGYVADADGRFDWAVPDEEVHAYINDRERAIGTHLFGRRMYEEIAGWEADEPARDQVPEMRAFAEVWRSIDKVVDSLTREDVSTARTRIERTFDTDAVRRLKLAAERPAWAVPSWPPTHAIRAALAHFAV